MVLLKELSLAVFLVMLLASAFQVWGQPACTSHILPNNTVDIDQYNNTGLLVIQTFMAKGSTGMTDCSLRCCETENCSLVIFTDDKNDNCLLIHCMSDDACSPIPSNTSQWIKSIRNNETNLANTSASSYTFNAAETTSASSPVDTTGNPSMKVPSLYKTSMTTTLPANTSVSKNNTELSQSSNSSIALVNSSSNATALVNSSSNATALVNSSSNATALVNSSSNATALVNSSSNATALVNSSSNATALVNSSSNATALGSTSTVMPTSIRPDNVTVENTTGLNASDAQELEPSNATSSNESFGTTDNSTGMTSSNGTVPVAEPVTKSTLLPSASSGANMTTSLENGTTSLSQNSSLTTQVTTAVVIVSNSTWQNSTNGTHASLNGLDANGHLPSPNSTAAEAAASPEEVAPVIGDHSMMVILVATLSIGMLLFIAIVAVVSKKAVDGWQRRHYSRIDYLVNGMYT